MCIQRKYLLSLSRILVLESIRPSRMYLSFSCLFIYLLHIVISLGFSNYLSKYDRGLIPNDRCVTARTAT